MTLVHHAGASSMRVLWHLAAALPQDRASAAGAALPDRMGLRLRKHRMLTGNLRIALATWSDAEIATVARASRAELGRVVAELPHFRTLLTSGDPPPLVELCGATGVLADAARGRPAILASGHFANWELLAGMAAREGVPLTVVHAARADPSIEALVAAHRRALGCAFLEQGESVLAMRRHIRAGRSIGVLFDQRNNDGEPVPFVGRSALTATAPAFLAVRLDLPFVPVRAERLGGCRFRITVEPPLRPNPRLGTARAMALDLMTRLDDRFAAWIRQRPERWPRVERRRPKQRRRTAVTTSLIDAHPTESRPHGLLDEPANLRRRAS